MLQQIKSSHSGRLGEKIKKIIFVLLFLLFSFRLWQTTGCKEFNGFYFNPLSVKINVESQTHLDPSQDFLISKIFHNKITALGFEVSKSLSKIVDTRFVLDVLGPAGLVLLVVGLLNIFKKQNLPGYIYSKRKNFVLQAGVFYLCWTALVLSVSLLSIPPKIAFWLIALSFYGLSFWGLICLKTGKILNILLIVLILASLWYFAINWQMEPICNEIFFH